MSTVATVGNVLLQTASTVMSCVVMSLNNAKAVKFNVVDGAMV